MPIEFAPRTIASARSERSILLGRLMRVALRRLARRISAMCERIVLARQYRRDMAILMQADHRMLRDIGVTRADIRAAARESGWHRAGGMLAAAAGRRRDAMLAAHGRRRMLPAVAAPSLAPRHVAGPVEAANLC